MNKFKKFLPVTVILVSFLLLFTGCGKSDSKTIKGIEISTNPTKLEYVIGDELDVSGIGINLVYKNDKKETLTIEDVSIDGFDSTSVGEKTITVGYSKVVNKT